MKKAKKTISELLAAWGKENRQIPPENDSLKNEILKKAQIPIIKIAHSPRHLAWLSYALAVTALLLLFISPKMTTKYPAPPVLPDTGSEEGQEINRKLLPKYGRPGSQPIDREMYEINNSATRSIQLGKLGGFGGRGLGPGILSIEERKRPMPGAIPNSEIPIKDTREFLKTSYSASARCRHIEEMVQRIQVSVRGYGGRVDSSSSSRRYGYINFAVPADRFDAFKNELKDLFGERFYSENIQTENLLPQKQSIEYQQQDTQGALRRLQTGRDGLKKSHAQRVAAIEKEMNALAAEIANLQTELSDDWGRRAFIGDRIWELQKKNTDLSWRLRGENEQFTRRLYSYDSQIRNNEADLVDLDKQDQHLMRTIATVRGSISLNWISIWEIIDLYIPIYWLAIFLMVAAVAIFFIHLRKNRLITI